MLRREFLQSGGAAAVLFGVGGVLWGRAAIARARLANTLVSNASPILVKREHLELTTIPDDAAEDMKLWFTGACLNASQFIDHICSEGFASRLRQFATQREREMCVENEFFARVISHSEIYQRMELVAKESGAVLDRNWQACCGEIASDWNLKLYANPNNVLSDLQARLDRLISVELQGAISRSANLADRPSVITAAADIGKASLMLLPLTRLPPPYNLIAVPVFALVAIGHLSNYAVGRLFRDPSGSKHAISDQLAILGNRVATEFNSELRARIADLHVWQNESLRKTAEEYARENVGVL